MRAVTLVFVALALAPVSTAQTCLTTSPSIEVAGFHVTEDRRYDNFERNGRLGCPNTGPTFILWVYEETNGIPGLQRNDEVRDDTCAGYHPADTIIL